MTLFLSQHTAYRTHNFISVYSDYVCGYVEYQLTPNKREYLDWLVVKKLLQQLNKFVLFHSIYEEELHFFYVILGLLPNHLHEQ